jgi:putative ABC transport system permease protein
MLASMAVLAWARLGQVRPLAIATARLVVQLSLLGYVLRWVFTHEGPVLIGAIALLMLVASAHTVGARQGRSAWTLRAEAFVTMGIGVALVMAVATRLALAVEPWYDARTVLPLLGMVLGNSVNGVALAAERLASELRAERDRVELRLALGATARQAAQPALQAAIRAALTPTIHGMMIAGIVAIPGMSTGQILAGVDVGTALRYQVLIYFAIAGTVAISTLLLLAVRLRRYFTAAHQLRQDLLDGS